MLTQRYQKITHTNYSRSEIRGINTLIHFNGGKQRNIHYNKHTNKCLHLFNIGIIQILYRCPNFRSTSKTISFLNKQISYFNSKTAKIQHPKWYYYYYSHYQGRGQSFLSMSTFHFQEPSTFDTQILPHRYLGKRVGWEPRERLDILASVETKRTIVYCSGLTIITSQNVGQNRLCLPLVPLVLILPQPLP